MSQRLQMSVQEMTALLREVSQSRDPGEPIRRIGLDMGELTDADQVDRGHDHLEQWNPYARLLQRLMRVEYASPAAASDAIFALLTLLMDISGPHGTVLTYLGNVSVRRLLIGIFLTAQLQEPRYSHDQLSG